MLGETAEALEKASRELNLKPFQELILAEVLEDLEVKLWCYYNAIVLGEWRDVRVTNKEDT